MWCDDYSYEWKQLRIVKPCRWVVQPAECFTVYTVQHEVTIQCYTGFYLFKDKSKSTLKLMLWLRRYKTCYLLLKNFIPTLLTDQIIIQNLSKILLKYKRYVYWGVNIMTWNITDYTDKYITAEKSNMYIPVSLSSSRSYHGNLQKRE